MEKVLVTGAGGFIGHHLVSMLKQKGYWVRGVDLKYPEYTEVDADQFEILDLRRWDAALEATRGVQQVYALAADMGGMGFISNHHAEILHNNMLINVHTLDAARVNGVERYLYSSSACIYPEFLQTDTHVTPLKESDAYPAQPQDGYGWEKLISELVCAYYSSDYGIPTRIVRFHNIYGPSGTYSGGREKAPAALCRKVAQARDGGTIEIWGDGEQTRSFCHIDDCIEGIYRLMQSDYEQPLNLGTDEMVSINELARLVVEASGKCDISFEHVPGPQGVRGRNSDNSLLRQVLGWEPGIRLVDGLGPTYRWIEKQVREAGGSLNDSEQQPCALTQDPPRVDVLGVGISCLTPESRWLRSLAGWLRASGTTCASRVFTAMESADAELKRIHNSSGMTTPDGMPMVWCARLAGQRHVSRVYGPDLMLAVLSRACAEGWGSFFYGGGFRDRRATGSAPGGPVPWPGRSGNARSAVPGPHPGGGLGHRPAHQCLRSPPRVGWARYTEAGALDGVTRASTSGQCCVRGGRSLRHSRRNPRAGTAVDAEVGAGVVLSARP
jgi:nucleoside-diphosphate-sugar epimerase